MRRTGDIECLQPDIAADAVLDVRDEIAGREAGGFLEKIPRALGAAARRNHAVAENVLLGDDGKVGRLEAVFEPDDADANGIGMHLQRLGPIRDGPDRRQPMIRQHAAEPLRGPFAPRRQQHAFLRRLQFLHVRRCGFEHIHAALCALGSKIAALLTASIDGGFRLWRLEW